MEYGKDLPPNELMMYTWEDATLRELTDLIKSAQPAAKRQNARLEFALVYPDKKGRNVMRQVSSEDWICGSMSHTEFDENTEGGKAGGEYIRTALLLFPFHPH